LIICRATQPFKASEETFMSYDISLEYDTRQKSLMTSWGFECDCALCAAEKANGADMRNKRMELLGEPDAFIERTPWAGAKKLAITKAQCLAQALDETHDGRRYTDVPRIHAQDIKAWLSKASPR
jgi:hypothetical protein